MAPTEEKSTKLPNIDKTNSQIGPIPSRRQSDFPPAANQGPRVPAKLLRLATLKVRNEDVPNSPRRKAQHPVQPYKKVHTLDDAMNARPPLQIDLEGPTPWTYTPRCKPTNEKNAPAYSFGRKTWPNKEGCGGRTSYDKTWFTTPHIWCDKVNFYQERKWPTPNQYPKRQLLGPNQITVPEAPSFTIGEKQAFSITKKGSEHEPSPNEYVVSSADNLKFSTGAAFTHQVRKETILWPRREITPGPGRYDPSINYSRPSKRSCTIHGSRKFVPEHNLGPFAIF